MKKKLWIIIPLLVVVIIVAAYWYNSSTQWERDFEIRYVDYVSDGNNSYYLYEITNKTNHTLKDVDAVIYVETMYGDFEYEDSVSYRVKPGETVEYKLYNKDYKREAEKRGMELGAFSVYSVDIVKIKY